MVMSFNSPFFVFCDLAAQETPPILPESPSPSSPPSPSPRHTTSSQFNEGFWHSMAQISQSAYAVCSREENTKSSRRRTNGADKLLMI